MAVAGITLVQPVDAGARRARIALAAAGVLDDGNTQVVDLKAGQCFNTVDTKLSDFGGRQGRPLHHGGRRGLRRRARRRGLRGLRDPVRFRRPVLPGVDGVTEDAQTNCVKYGRTYLDGKAPPASDKLYFYLPPRRTGRSTSAR